MLITCDNSATELVRTVLCSILHEYFIDIGSRLELMVDDYLIARLNGDAKRRLNRPIPREAVLVTDKPWEGNASTSFTIFQDGDIYRMYYHAKQLEHKGMSLNESSGVTCYAESTDGINWVRPDLGLIEHNGSKKNNIIIDSQALEVPGDAFVPFKDDNPNAAPDAKYKAWATRFPNYSPGAVTRKGHSFEVTDGLHALKLQTVSTGPR